MTEDSMTLKVGPVTYTVKEASDRGLGEVQYNDCTVYLKSGLASGARRMTLWHEVIHIILVHAGYRDHDEKQLDTLATGIMQVLQDNPGLRQGGDQCPLK